ncbi:MAG: arginase family protein [Candidatus Marsarchaeota archaeon]|nr:arginase family protein [Candidatus Marsarchaeota archaeon]
MNKFALSNNAFGSADFVVFGVADETGSTAKRKGASLAPAEIRRVFNKFEIIKKHGNSFFEPVDTSLERIVQNFKVCDLGDIEKKDARSQAYRILDAGKVPICIGGDHSITHEILHSINKKMQNLGQKFSVVYFDAHPDFISSHTHYYGSVLYDASKLDMLDIEKSVLVGIRESEKEEMENMRKYKIKSVPIFDFKAKPIGSIASFIRKTVLKNVYVSIDMDVVDPAFAPGVDVPAPGGISSLDMLYLIKSVAPLSNLGADIMELSPPHDINSITSMLCIKILEELIVSLKKPIHGQRRMH